MRYIVEFDLADVPEHLWPRVVAAALRDAASRVEGYDFQHERTAFPVRPVTDPDGLLGYHGYATTVEGMETLRREYGIKLGVSPAEREAMRDQARTGRVRLEELMSERDEDEEPVFRP